MLVVHLTVRMWVGTPHNFALVFKYLDPPLCLAEVFHLTCPLIYYPSYLLHCHQWKGNIRTRVETHHTTRGWVE